jgi:hypothetical protein
VGFGCSSKKLWAGIGFYGLCLQTSGTLLKIAHIAAQANVECNSKSRKNRLRDSCKAISAAFTGKGVGKKVKDHANPKEEACPIERPALKAP